MIYFDRPTQERLFQTFADALAARRIPRARQGGDAVRPGPRPARAGGPARARVPAARVSAARSSSAWPTSGSARATTSWSRSDSGSCVAIVLHDAEARRSAAWRTSCCRRRRSAATDDNPAKFPQTAVPRLLELMASGARARPPDHGAAGRAARACSPRSPRRARSRWASATWSPARQVLYQHGVPLVGEAVGGDYGRTVRLCGGGRAGRGQLGGAWHPAASEPAQRPGGGRQSLLPPAAHRRGGRAPASSASSPPRGTAWTRCRRCTTTSPTWCSWTSRCPSSTASAPSATSCPNRPGRSWW